jgi:hypothetical protein
MWTLDERSKTKTHEHCYHAYRGAIHMVIPDGHVLEKCCKCSETRLIHVDHAHHGQLKQPRLPGERTFIESIVKAK